jgi:hypothetical protein
MDRYEMDPDRYGQLGLFDDMAHPRNSKGPGGGQFASKGGGKPAQPQATPQPTAAPQSPAAPKSVPDWVKERVGRTLAGMKEHHDSLKQGRSTDQQFGGGGRYEWETHDKMRDKLAGHQADLQKFLDSATKEGVDGEAILAELGGVPDFTLSPSAQEWEADHGPKSEVAQASKDHTAAAADVADTADEGIANLQDEDGQFPEELQPMAQWPQETSMFGGTQDKKPTNAKPTFKPSGESELGGKTTKKLFHDLNWDPKQKSLFHAALVDLIDRYMASMPGQFTAVPQPKRHNIAALAPIAAPLAAAAIPAIKGMVDSATASPKPDKYGPQPQAPTANLTGLTEHNPQPPSPPQTFSDRSTRGGYDKNMAQQVLEAIRPEIEAMVQDMIGSTISDMDRLPDPTNEMEDPLAGLAPAGGANPMGGDPMGGGGLDPVGGNLGAPTGPAPDEAMGGLEPPQDPMAGGPPDGMVPDGPPDDMPEDGPPGMDGPSPSSLLDEEDEEEEEPRFQFQRANPMSNPQRYAALHEAHGKLIDRYEAQEARLHELELDNKRLRSKMEKAEKAEKYAKRRGALVDKKSLGIVLDVDDEMQLTDDYSDEQFERHLQVVDRYQKAPVDESERVPDFSQVSERRRMAVSDAPQDRYQKRRQTEAELAPAAKRIVERERAAGNKKFTFAQGMREAAAAN